MEETFYSFRKKGDFVTRFSQIVTKSSSFITSFAFALGIYKGLDSFFYPVLFLIFYFILFHFLPFLFKPFAIRINEETISFYYFFRPKYTFSKQSCTAFEKPGILNIYGAKSILVIRNREINGRYFQIPNYWVDFELLTNRLSEENIINTDLQQQIDSHRLLKRYNKN